MNETDKTFDYEWLTRTTVASFTDAGGIKIDHDEELKLEKLRKIARVEILNSGQIVIA